MSYLDSPLYREMLAKTLSQGQPASQYPLQAGANTLAQLLQTWQMKKSSDAQDAKQQAGGQALADVLAPPDYSQTPATQQTAMNGASIDTSVPNVQNANAGKNQQLAQLLGSGAISADAVAPQVMQSLGLGAREKPMTVGVNDRLVDPTGKVLLGAQDQYDQTPQYDQTGRAYVLDKQGGIKYLDGVSRPAPQPEAPMSAERYGQEKGLATARADVTKPNWQVLTDPKTNTQYRYDLNSGAALTLDGKPYVPEGAGKINSGTVRSAASLAAQRYVEEHPDATAEDVARFAADYGKTVKSTAAFSTGKQGDLIRSFNVAISHLNTLDGLVDALGNGNVQALNTASNYFKQQTGSAAPTNFDAAKAIVGDEIIKAIVGGGGALADRENAQNQINRANSPAQLRGVIKTYKELMGGQLRGLAKQYSDTTGLNDFNSRLSPETIAELEGHQGGAAPAPQNAPAGTTQTKVLNGKTYYLINGQWHQ